MPWQHCLLENVILDEKIFFFILVAWVPLALNCSQIFYFQRQLHPLSICSSAGTTQLLRLPRHPLVGPSATGAFFSSPPLLPSVVLFIASIQSWSDSCFCFSGAGKHSVFCTSVLSWFRFPTVATKEGSNLNKERRVACLPGLWHAFHYSEEGMGARG